MRILSYVLSTGMGVLFVSSCAVGPEYTPPQIDPPDQFVSQDVFAGLTTEVEAEIPQLKAPMNRNWWEGFQDETLNHLVNQALMNNYNIASASARLQDAYAQLMLAESGDKIQIDADLDTGGSQRYEFGDDDDSTTQGDVFGSLSFAWPVDAFGRTRREVEAALARVEEASAAYRSTVLAVSSNVAREYLRLRGNQRQLTLLEESVDLQKQTLNIVQSRYNTGLAPELDLRRAEASVANLEADIPPLQEELINGRNVIDTLTGRFPGRYTEMLSTEEAIPSYKGTIPSLMPMDVLLMRPDVQQAEARLKAAVANIGAAKAEWYPIVRLSKQLSVGGSGVLDGQGVGVLFASIGALIRQVVTDGGERQAVLDSAEARAQEALSNYRQILLLAVEDVERSLSSLQSSLDRQMYLDQAVKASDSSFRQAESLYRLGLTSFIDVVDAQRVLASAQQKLASAKTAYAVEVANLFRVLGVQINR